MTHTELVTHPLYGVMAEFEDETALLVAARKAREEGFTRFEAYSPIPIHGMGEAIGYTKTKVPLVCLIGGLTGCSFGYLLQYYVNLIAYPINIAGRPLHSIPAFIPPAYECTILFAGLSAAFGMLLMNGLPHPYHPVNNVERFRKYASSEGFFLCIEAGDSKFERSRTTEFLKSLSPKGVYDVEA